MRVVLLELQKIFNLKRMIVVTILCALLSFLFLEFHFRVFPNGSNIHSFQMTEQMIEEFGAELDLYEFAIINERFVEDLAEFNTYFLNRTDVQGTNLNSVTELWYNQDSAVVFELMNRLAFEDNNIDYWNLQVRYHFISDIERLIEDGMFIDVQPIFDLQVFHNWVDIISWSTLILVVTVLVIILPIFVSERKSNMFQIQYTTKLGRELYGKKLIAVTLASLIGTTLLVGSVVGLYFLMNQTTTFFPNLIWTNWGESTLRYDMTFLNYILLTVGLTYVLGLIFAFIAFFISRISSNHLTALALGIPLIVIFEMYLSNYLIRNVLSIWINGAMPILLYAGLIIITIAILFVQGYREKRIDILY